MIVYFSGPEGGGKTALMTRYNRIHHLMGGECWAFPGYELLNERGRTVSKLVYPEDIMGILDQMHYIVLSIDEIQNFMHHHHWYENLVDIMTYGAAAQRRKREFVILATGPIFDWVPHDLRQMFHEVIHCKDRHWKNHIIPRGQQIEFYREDRRGVLSGAIGRTTRPQTFWAQHYYKYFDTFSLVDPKYQFHKIKVLKTVTRIDETGRRVEKPVVGISDPETIDRYIQTYEDDHQDLIFESVKQAVKKFRDSNISKVEADILYQSLGSNKTAIGQALSRLGASYHTHKRIYDLSGITL